MISRIPATSLAIAAALAHAAFGQGDEFRAPDSLVLKDGRTVKGLIVKNTAKEVTLQEEFAENVYPKSEIVRIRDEADLSTFYTEANRRGDLPAWRVIANDLRANDSIKSLVEIPATAIDIGIYAYVPYLSFRANENIEINIYGDPNDPAAVEFGIYGSKRGSEKVQKILRSFLAGFLTSRQEVAAIYGIPLKGGQASAGDMTVRVSPPSDEDSYGGWWISIYNKKDLAAAKLTPEAYARLTKPSHEVVDKRGRVIAEGWSKKELAASHKIADEDSRVLLRGFYRDESGTFRPIVAPTPTN